MKQLMLLILSILCWGSAVNAQPLSGVRGKVTNGNGTPLVNVSVLATPNRITGVTDAHGLFSLNMLAGKYSLTFRKQGYRDTTLRNLALQTGQTILLNIRLSAAPIKAVKFTPPVVATDDYKKDMLMGSGTKSVGYAHAEVYQYAQAAPAFVSRAQYYNPSTETYKKDPENDFKSVKASPLSTLSVDVDRASYSNVRRFINQGQKPPADAVRIEEMVNYFDYNYPSPTGNDPIAINTELTECPWDKDLKLLHIGIQAKKINTDKLPASNLVFLIDVSGSMEEANKLPLVKAALKLLVSNLRAQDKVSIVVYAGNAGLVLPPTSGDRKATIIEALDKLEAGGSTAGGQGILLAYKTAEANLVKGGNNRVILATDGDFNVGVSNENDLEDLIVQQRDKGIYLTCLGFGMGNYKDSKMELMADKGNGNYDYIDNIQEAQKTLVSEFGGTLFTVAKDVKAQIEFNPAKVQGYRLVGYENRLLNTEDFKDDKKDAGDMGAGHTVTILYELIPTGVKSSYMRDNDGLKYQTVKVDNNTDGNELATVKFRYKQPDGNISKEIVHPIGDRTTDIAGASENTRFAASVAMFGMLLKGSKYKGQADYSKTIALAETARGRDKEGYRAEYIRMVKAVK